MKQWKCKTCRTWVSMAYLKHFHKTKEANSVDEMVAARDKGIDLTEHVTFGDPETWTPQHETREAPSA